MNWKTYTIWKGWHFSWPRTPKIWFWDRNITLEIDYDFTEAMYDEIPDQWNKVGGLSVGWFEMDRNAVMLAHMVNHDSGEHWASIYINKDDKKWYASPPVIGPKGKAIIRRNDNALSGEILSNKDRKGAALFYEMPKNRRPTIRVQPYFGGRSTAPNTVKYKVIFN